jgi:CheY-like chemotaxis protein
MPFYDHSILPIYPPTILSQGAAVKMVQVDSKDATREILQNIQSRDLIKAKIVLSYFDHLDLESQRRILYELSKCDDNLAIFLLVSLSVSHPRAVELYPTLPETILSKAFNNPAIIVQQLKQKSVEQMYYVQLTGTMRLQQAVPVLLNILQSSKDSSLLRAVLETLGAIGAPETVSAVADFLSADDPQLVNAAIAALGEIATPAAMVSLANGLGKNDITDQCIMDVFGVVQDEAALHQLNTIMLTGKAALRNYSKGVLLSIGAKAVPILTNNLDINDVDLQIHSLNLLQAIGDAAASQPIRNLINRHPKDSNVRFAAYEALACLPRRNGDYVLAGGLNDPVEDVRLAAAQAIDHNLDGVLLTGIQNMVSQGDAEAARIIKAVVDAKAQKLFLGLKEEPFFRKVAVEYLATKAHSDIKDTFVTLLRDLNIVDLAEQITLRAATLQKSQLHGKICAVDDSKMILNIYRRILNDLGYEPVLFEYPAEALSWLQQEKPSAVCTDLNMPEITGIELTRKIRTKYSKAELPIIMVTTQDDSQDHQAAVEAGVNTVMAKPFDVEKLAGILKLVIKVKSNE